MYQPSRSIHQIRRFSHEDIERRKTPRLAQNVILPEEFWRAIRQITEISNEVRLILFATMQETEGTVYHLVDYFNILAHGDAGSIDNIPSSRFNLAETFLKMRRDEELKTSQKTQTYHIDAHTHPFHPDSYFATHFSGGDLNSFGKIIARGETNYRHVLFSRSHVVTFGSTPMSFQLAHGNQAIMSHYARLKQMWDMLEAGLASS